jgi:ABC-2 type transport system ATP-binding protein
MIQIEDLHKHYGAVRALDGLNLHVEAGQVFGFLGPNGAGKTTTLRILTGLVHPTRGRASIAGLDASRQRQALTRLVGYLPEEPAFYPWWTPQEFLDYLGRLHRLPAPTRARRIRETLEQVGLHKVARRRIGGFSRGMRQRLGLAAALLHRPEVLLLDEPVSALDPLGRKEILELIGNLRGECTVLMSTHILADVERICDTIGIIVQGRLLLQSPRAILLERYAQPLFEMVSEEEALHRWAESLATQGWVREIHLQDDVLRVVVEDAAQARHKLLASAVAQQVPLRRFEEVQPSLEEVFVRLVNGEIKP